MLSAAFTGTVDFSTTIFDRVAIFEMVLAADSTYVKSGALPYLENYVKCERKNVF